MHTSRTSRYLLGSEELAWTRLTETFESTSQAAKFQTKEEYEGMTLKDREYPEIFITNIEKLIFILTEKFSVTIDDDGIIGKIVKSLPKE